MPEPQLCYVAFTAPVDPTDPMDPAYSLWESVVEDLGASKAEQSAYLDQCHVLFTSGIEGGPCSYVPPRGLISEGTNA